MLSGPNQRNMEQTLMQPCPIWAKWLQKRPSVQSDHIMKTKSEQVNPKVAAFMGKVKCKKYPKAVLKFIMKKEQMQVRELHEQQDIKPTAKQPSADARIAALEAQLGISSQLSMGDNKKKEGDTPKEPA